MLVPMTSSGDGSAGVTDRDHVAGERLPVITDDSLRERIGRAQPYTAVLIRKTAKYQRPQADATVWEHGRRNVALAEHGVLAIVMPVSNDPTDWAGLAVFTAPPDEVAKIMDHDPGVQAGIFSYEIHPLRGFPGAALPA